MVKICKICNKKFNHIRHNRAICSSKCQTLNIKRIRAKSLKKHPFNYHMYREKHPELKIKARSRYKEKYKPKIKNCIICSKSFSSKERMSAKTCGDICRDVLRNKNKKIWHMRWVSANIEYVKKWEQNRQAQKISRRRAIQSMQAMIFSSEFNKTTMEA